jgi:hypothetical protein
VSLVLKWLLMCGILAGLGVRAAPHIHAFSHSHPHCHADHHHSHDGDQEHTCHGEPWDFPAETPLDEGHPSDSDGPGDFHHQHVCCHLSPMVIDGAAGGCLSLLEFSRIGVIADGARLPAEPTMELDTPPLI